MTEMSSTETIAGTKRPRWKHPFPARLILLALGLLLTGCAVRMATVANLVPAGGTDVTLVVAADTHVGAEGIDPVNRRQIAAMNALAGTPWPMELGGKVAEPAAVIIAGDLTNHGFAGQWKQFKALYGQTSEGGLLKYPTMLLSGNHDRHVPLIRPAVDGVRRKHGALRYSRDFGDLHVVCLDEYPDAAGRRWLANDLAAVGRRLPVLLVLHYSITGPYSQHWSEKDKTAFGDTIAGFNVIGIFHGHYHGSGRYRWRGYDVFNVGSPRHAAHSFAAVRVTDTHLYVASWNYDASAWRWQYVTRINR